MLFFLSDGNTATGSKGSSVFANCVLKIHVLVLCL